MKELKKKRKEAAGGRKAGEMLVLVGFEYENARGQGLQAALEAGRGGARSPPESPGRGTQLCSQPLGSVTLVSDFGLRDRAAVSHSVLSHQVPAGTEGNSASSVMKPMCGGSGSARLPAPAPERSLCSFLQQWQQGAAWQLSPPGLGSSDHKRCRCSHRPWPSTRPPVHPSIQPFTEICRAPPCQLLC